METGVPSNFTGPMCSGSRPLNAERQWRLAGCELPTRVASEGSRPLNAERQWRLDLDYRVAHAEGVGEPTAKRRKAMETPSTEREMFHAAKREPTAKRRKAMETLWLKVGFPPSTEREPTAKRRKAMETQRVGIPTLRELPGSRPLNAERQWRPQSQLVLSHLGQVGADR